MFFLKSVWHLAALPPDNSIAVLSWSGLGCVAIVKYSFTQRYSSGSRSPVPQDHKRTRSLSSLNRLARSASSTTSPHQTCRSSPRAASRAPPPRKYFATTVRSSHSFAGVLSTLDGARRAGSFCTHPRPHHLARVLPGQQRGAGACARERLALGARDLSEAISRTITRVRTGVRLSCLTRH
jgi:hypothetical protein